MNDIGIDLGTANILIYQKGQGVVLCEPSVVAINEKTGEIIAYGKEARAMLGRTNENIRTVRPLREGVISDFSITEKMLNHFIRKVLVSKKINKPRIAVCIPSKITDVERRAVIEATRRTAARDVYLITEPLAAAIGCGIQIERPEGSMIIDIGGGTTDVAVISLGGTVVSETIRVAGDDFDQAIMKYMRKEHKLLIGERSAELLKVNVGTVHPDHGNNAMEIKGRDLTNGLPATMIVTQQHMYQALAETAEQIVEITKKVFEATPPELASDIYDKGIYMTGGGSLIDGLDKLIEERTGVKVIVPDDALFCVAVGTGLFVELMSNEKFSKDFRLD